ncbi:MAG: class I SAM-dependent methyltransferase [Eubacteriales bacterium]|nr:class I SAM-dependent methyltransferase [Eubacteriales bacterium]
MLGSKGFDLWADGYDKSVGVSDEENTYPFAGYKRILGDIYKIIMKKPKSTVLDIGFGTGTLTTKLYENGCVIYGQDFSKRMIELASEKMPKAHLYHGDFTNGLVEALKEELYDFIVLTYSIHHLTTDEKNLFLKDLLEHLKDGGKILIGDVAFENREKLEECRDKSGDEWDNDESYCVADELIREFPNLIFNKMTFCSGVLILSK